MEVNYRKLMSILLVLGIVLAFSGLALAQRETGSIQGTVTDPSGAVIAGAKVVIKSVATGAAREAVSGPSGLYNVTNLQPGVYDVTVAAEGFASQTLRTDVAVGSTHTLDVKLAVGKEVTVVEVTTAPVEVDTKTQELSTVVTTKQVTDLPSLSRNPYDFVITAPNVATGDINTFERGVGVNINGARSASTDVLLDGGENVDLFVAQTGQQTPLDSVQELSVVTNNFDASYGRASGGVVNVATKSGSNAFHGTLYEFNRLSYFTANTYANAASGSRKPGYTRNQFGGGIGGPIIKDKLFFFGSVELIRVRSQATVQSLVIDPGFLAASDVATRNFFNAWGPALRPGTALVSQLTFCQLVTCTGLNPGIVGYDPSGTLLPVLDHVTYNAPSDSGGGTPQNTYMAVGRIDWNITDKTMFYARYAMYKENDFAGSVNSSPYPGYDTPQLQLNQNWLLNLTHIFTPNLVSQTKFVYNRLNLLQPLGEQPVGPTLYMSDFVGVRLNGISVDFPGYSQRTPGNAIPFGGPQNLFQWYEDLSWNKGKHTFKFGGSYIFTQDNRVFGAYEEATMALVRGTVDNATSLQNLFDGFQQRMQVALFPQGNFPCHRDPFTGAIVPDPSCALNGPLGPPSFARSNLYNDISAYAMDSWRIHPRVTLNLGVRWEYYGVQHNRNQNLDSNFYFGSAACPSIAPGCPGYALPDMIANGAAFTSPTSPIHSLWRPQYHNFAPRVGFAWDVFGNGKTSLRGGYGIGYERNFGNVTFNVIQNPPNYAVVQIRDLAIQDTNLGPMGGPGPQLYRPTSLRFVDNNIDTAYNQFWSLTLEHEVAKNTLLSVGYSGSKGTHLYDIKAFGNGFTGCMYIGGPYIGPDCLGLNGNVAMNTQYSSINERGSDGFSSYHALIVAVRSSNFHDWGLTFNANYTFSHAIDNLTTTFSESFNNFDLGYMDPFNPALDKGSGDNDARHRFVFSGIWDVPVGKNSTGFVKQLINGWELAPIYTVRSGLPFTVWDCGNGFFLCVRSTFNSTPNNHVSSNPVNNGGNSFTLLTLPSGVSYADPILGLADFGTCTGIPTTVFPCPYPSTMSRRNYFVGPSNWNFNLGIYKNFKLSEKFTLQFRNEWYNVFNHHNFYVDGSAAEADCFTAGDGLCTLGGGINNFGPAGGTGFPAPTITGVKGGFGTSADERRFIQFALKLIF